MQSIDFEKDQEEVLDRTENIDKLANKIKEMQNKIEEPMEYINAITKLLPYAIGKKKAVDEQDLDNDRVRIIHVNIAGKEI